MEEGPGGTGWRSETTDSSPTTTPVDEIPPKTSHSLQESSSSNSSVFEKVSMREGLGQTIGDGPNSDSDWSFEKLSPPSSDHFVDFDKLTPKSSERSFKSDVLSPKGSEKSLNCKEVNSKSSIKSWLNQKYQNKSFSSDELDENETTPAYEPDFCPICMGVGPQGDESYAVNEIEDEEDEHGYSDIDSENLSSRMSPSSSDNSIHRTHKSSKRRTRPWELLHSAESVETKIKMCNEEGRSKDTMCFLYIMPCNRKDVNEPNTIKSAILVRHLEEIVTGDIFMHETQCGLVCEFTNELDADRVAQLRLASVFGEPVLAWKFFNKVGKNDKVLVVRDMPWCVPIVEISNALKAQGIGVEHVSRRSGVVRIHVKNTVDVERLIQEGLCFFDCANFSVELESYYNDNEEQDLLQCYHCQRFWHHSIHCKYSARCVRCGENHDVSKCETPRDKAKCCLCGGAHHAAYKLCPVRIQQANAVQIDISLSKGKPPRTDPLKYYYD